MHGQQAFFSDALQTAEVVLYLPLSEHVASVHKETSHYNKQQH